MFLVAETFLSINGEGLEAGRLAYFIRLAGCPLRCDYCDTKWAQTKEAGKVKDLETLLNEVSGVSAQFVTLTGGEPLAAEGILELIEGLMNRTDKHIEIETSGAVNLSHLRKKYAGNSRLRFTVDYKLSSSGMNGHMYEDHYTLLETGDVIKYVIGSEEDLRQAVAHLGQLKAIKKLSPTPIFSPVFGKIEPSRLVDVVKAENLAEVKIQLQLHKYIWNPLQQGV